jgi:hypothetical protein
MEMDLSEQVKEKLAEAVQLWADENLFGRPAPAFICYCVYSSVEGELLKKQKEIEEIFPIKKDGEK